MKRILLTPVLEINAQDYLKDLRALPDNPEARLERLIRALSSAGYQDGEKYVDIIRQHYSEIVTASPEQMVNDIEPLFTPYLALDVSMELSLEISGINGTKKRVTKKFYSFVVEALRYDDVQAKVFPKYIKKMGIKSCVYCNAQYAVATKRGKIDEGTIFRSTYTLDHHKPKSKYPYLASSFFNLYPCCSTCNQTKSYRDPIFELYVRPSDSTVRRNPFEFRLDSYSFVKYSMSGNVDDLEVSLKTKAGIPQKELDDYENYFHISDLYNNYNDIVEEVIWKYRMYNEAGRCALRASFESVLPNLTDFNRFILGNYDREADMLKRPLAKLVHDVARQLGIL